MAIDKLDTLKQEFNTVKRQLHIRSAEVQQLKELVARSSNTLGQVELERDFYRPMQSNLDRSADPLIKDKGTRPTGNSWHQKKSNCGG